MTDLNVTESVTPRDDAATLRALEEHLQCNLEFEMKQAGTDAYMTALNELAGTAETKLGHGRRLVGLTLDKAALEITVRRQAILENKQAARRAVAVKHLKTMDAPVLAYLAAKALLDGVSVSHPLNKVALRLGGMVEDEQRLTKFAEVNPKAFRWTMKRVADSPSRSYKLGVSRGLMRLKDIPWNSWSASDKLQVGIWLIDAYNHATGLFRCDMVVTGQGKQVQRQHFIVPEPDTLEWVRKAAAQGELLATEYWPTLIPPKPWTRPWGGGYYTPVIRKLPLVKTRGHKGARAYLEELRNRDLSLVYDAVNSVQSTAWAINRPVLEVFQQVIDRELMVSGLPPLRDEDAPPKPTNIETDEIALKRWKKAMSIVHGRNSKHRSKRVQVRRTLHMAQKFAAYPAFYFPHNMDFRGRLYAIPPFLNPQGADCAKGLLTFSQGKPIETEEQLEWLAIHGANTYGVDKVSYADRWNWAVDSTEAVKAVADDPFEPAAWDFWTKADSPFQFLAWCFEWAKVIRGGYGTLSALPVALDGSCNGIQHYSAALRDPIGGAAVNLVPADKPQDIYGVVAERVVERLRELKDTSGPDGDMARKWLAFGVDRKITKRPVMTLPYGSTLFSVREFVEDAMREKLEGGAENPFAAINDKGDRVDNLFEGSRMLQGIVWDSIGRTVVAAREAMDWLQAVAKVVATEGLPIVWTTPDGFPVQQAYVEQTAYRVKTKLDGEYVQINLAEDTHVMCRRRQRNGIAPNWVHSMDAAALRVFVNMAADNGVDAFCLVHDSYGARAADVPVVAVCLRESFVMLYDNRNALAAFLKEVTPPLDPKTMGLIPPLPVMGSLDLSLVRGSAYFFA